MGRTGPTIGSANAPMIAEAGESHVIFSKKLLGFVVFVFLATGLIFFSIEQSRITRNLTISRAALAQNNKIRAANSELESSRQALQSELEELMSINSKWLDEDASTMDMTQEQQDAIKAQFKEVQAKIDENSKKLKDKDLMLEDKAKRLAKYQFKIQQKQKNIEDMTEIIRTLNGTVPKGTQLGAPIDDYEWQDYNPDGEDYYDAEGGENLEDDWMSDDQY